MTTRVDYQALPEQADIAIVGAGLSGLCLALFLARQQPSWSILLLGLGDTDRPPISDGEKTGFSHRQIALAESSRRLFLSAGLWPQIEHQSAPIREIHISDRGHPGHSQLLAAEQGLEAYGHVIDAARLANLLSAAVDRLANVRRADYSSRPAAQALILKPKAGGMGIHLGDKSIVTRLTLLANGERPEQAQALGIQFKHKDYQRLALTAELGLMESHRGIAYERFTEAGPLALLPLPDDSGSSRAALVWTLLPELGERLLSATADHFIDQLQAYFGDRAGQIRSVSHRHLVPLSLTLASEQVRSHLALMGTAAHSLHPVAGQGFNLTIRDIMGLCEALAGVEPVNGELGDLAILQGYEQSRAVDQQQVTAFSDALPELFASTNPLLSGARNLGLLGLDLAPGLRAAVARFGAGLMTREVPVNG